MEGVTLEAEQTNFQNLKVISGGYLKEIISSESQKVGQTCKKTQRLWFWLPHFLWPLNLFLFLSELFSLTFLRVFPTPADN